MDFKKIELSDRPYLIDCLKMEPPQVSELTFTNLFMWRFRYCPKWACSDESLFVMMEPNDGDICGLPFLGLEKNPKEKLHRFFEELARVSDSPRIIRADRAFVEAAVDENRYNVEFDRDNSDYVYLTEDLINLSGNKFHKKKNHINKFKRTYNYTYKELDKNTIEQAMTLQEDWCEFRDCIENPDLFQEDRAVYEALTNFEELGCVGGAIEMEGKIEAFSFGEMLNPDTAVIHVEKANPEIQGLYTVIAQSFLAHAWKDVKYVNREQDLGLEGLRKAKESYHPDHLTEKFTITPK